MSRRDSLDLADRRTKADTEERELKALLSKYGRLRSSSSDSMNSGRLGNTIPQPSSRFEDETKDEDDDADDMSYRKQFGSSSSLKTAKKVRGILSTAKAPSDRNLNHGKRRVSFNRMATVHHMPGHEQLAARRSRKGPWEPAPDHDELWDGDLQEFRPVPLTSRELRDLLVRKDHEISAMNEYGSYGLSYTYPPASYEYSSYADGDMDELDSYLNEMSFSSSLDSANLSRAMSSTGQSLSTASTSAPSSAAVYQDDRGCYVCRSTIDWTPREVGNWVRDHVAGGDFLSANFEENFVDGPMLLQMEERDLRNVGIKRRSDRAAILNSMEDLHRGCLTKQTCHCSNNSSSHDVFDRHSQFLKDSESLLRSF